MQRCPILLGQQTNNQPTKSVQHLQKSDLEEQPRPPRMTKLSPPSCPAMTRRIRVPFPAILATLFLSFSTSVHAFKQHKGNVVDCPLLTEKIGSNSTIIVDLEGKGHFTSIQKAIDSVPEGNGHWVTVHIRKGIYREKVKISKSRPYIFLRGNGRGKTVLSYSESSSNNRASATFIIDAPHVVIFGITFKNEAPTGVAYTSQNQSVAAFVGSDMVAFYHCAFVSTHNTLFDFKGRHYYDNCYIQGSIDFIFGRARTIFHNCEIFVVDDKRVSVHGSITAQNRDDPYEYTGFVFLKGKVYGIGQVYLGRAKGSYSTVLFAETYLSKTIVPEGWTNWSYHGKTDHMFHAEYECHGPGADRTGRAPWSRQLTKEDAAKYLSVDYIDGKNWLPAWL